jgi:tetratricopeptide (TPR) repeat protein
VRRRTVVVAVLSGAALGAGVLAWAIPTPGSRLEGARELALAGKHGEAIREYREVLASLDPTDPSVRPERVAALEGLGNLLYLEAGEPAAAADAYRRLILESPTGPESRTARERLADIARRHLHDLPEAIAHEQALAASGQPGTDRFAYRAAKGYLELREYEQCRREARALLEANPESEWADDALFLVATSFQIEGKHREAIGAFREIGARFPGTEAAARALHGIGGELLALGELEEALATLVEALQVHPQPALVQPDIARARELLARARERRETEGGREAHLTR